MEFGNIQNSCGNSQNCGKLSCFVFKVIVAGVHTFRTPKETSFVVYGYNLNVFCPSFYNFVT